MSAPKLQLNNISKIYPSGVAALEQVELEIVQDEILCLVGPSGCGKTTLLNLIAGFDRPTGGEILLDGIQIDESNRACGMVFQSDSVFPWMTVAQNVSYGLRFNGTPRRARARAAAHYLQLVGLEDFAGRWPRELSGGMRKRVDLARTYAFNPHVLLLDEPFGSLDIFTKEEMQRLLHKVWQTEKKTVLFVTHDVEEAVFIGHRVAVMTSRPGTIGRVLNVPFAIPREPALKLTPEFLGLRRQVVEALQHYTNSHSQQDD